MYRAQLTQNFSAVTGACLLTRREIFDQAGGLNETLAVSFNDVDLCLRIIECGYRVLWTPYARLYHLESISRGLDDTPEKSARFAKEEEYMQLRWGELFLRDSFYNPNLTQTREDFSLDGMQPRVQRPWR
jgi:cellulose synthase/poly-beta-1,6-N-acetylglucosamine synthase-like glycosyltransferase